MDAITYSVTFQTLTPDGEEVDAGFELQDQPLTIGPGGVVAAVVNLLDEYGAGEYAGHGATWYTADADIDIRTGEHTTRAIHLKGLSDVQVADVLDRVPA